MNRLEVQDLGKKFYRQWVFRNLSFEADSDSPLLVTGTNGSGKSTLTRILAGQLLPDEGTVKLILNGNLISPETIYREVSWAAPYLELYPDLELGEAVELHFRFKENLLGNIPAFLNKISLQKSAEKPLRNLSSGMMARLKNALAVFSRSSLLLLDEPTGNLDEENVSRLFEWISEFNTDRIIIFVSNDNRDFPRFSKKLDLSSLK